jgi:hypothetical protein
MLFLPMFFPDPAAETAAVGPTSIGEIDEDPNINWSDLENIEHFE